MTLNAWLSGFPANAVVAVPEEAGLYRIEADSRGAIELEGITLPGLSRFMALQRYKPWWLCPAWGSRLTDLPAHECQMLLWQRTDGRWGVLIPTTQGNRRAWLSGRNKQVALCTRGQPDASEPARLCVAIAGIGDDPTTLIDRAIAAGMDHLRTCRPRTAKPVPTWVDWFGWCTWNAFYQHVSAAKIEAGLEAFARAGLPVPLLLIDDGWQQVTKEGQLLSFAADPEKFPGGLAPLVDAAKSRHGVQMVGVWHALVGYWSGPQGQSELARRYRLCPSYRMPYNDTDGKPHPRSLVHPDDIHRFYQEFHAGLAAQGVAMVKIDGQSSLDQFTEHIVPDYLTGKAYQQALQSGAAMHFGNNLLSCMGMSGDVLWNLGSSAVLRNSDDFFPDKPESHGFHVCANAANALYTAAFAIPDWDMFHSAHASGWFHGAARAISGGPVYVSDVPEKHDVALIQALTLSGGRVARPQPARVADSRILVDCMQENRLLLIRAETAAGRLLGAFHCRFGEGVGPITDGWSPGDAGATGRVAVRGFRAKVTRTMDARTTESLTLDPIQWEVFSIAPFVDGVAVLGLDGKLAGLAAVSRWEALGEGVFLAEVADGGVLRVVSERTVRARRPNGEALAVRHEVNGDWLIDLPLGAAQKVLVTAS